MESQQNNDGMAVEHMDFCQQKKLNIIIYKGISPGISRSTLLAQKKENSVEKY